MAAVPRELIESELFGHEKGAFTGAQTARYAGRFEQAAGGTLFLDEIGDMPLEAQTRLLRVLQEGEYLSVGGHMPIKASARIIAATHRDLRQLVRQGLFREDLFYRLNVVPIRMPPLRERGEDIVELLQHFFQASRGRRAASQAPRQRRRWVPSRPIAWPGNVRELENLIRRLSALYSQDVIGADVVRRELARGKCRRKGCWKRRGGRRRRTGVESLGDAVERHLRTYFAAHERDLPAAGLHGRIVREVERPLIELSLAATGGNQIRAAKMLGLNRNTLHKKIRELDIRVIRGLK